MSWNRGGRRPAPLRRWSTLLAVIPALIAGLLVATPAAAMPTAVEASVADVPATVPAVAPATTEQAAAIGSGPVKTADLSKFRPGNIISDAVFFNSGSMSAAQIQAFLEAKMPSCASGYTCLKDWYDTSRTTGRDAMCAPYAGGVRERASQIIYKVARACGINPQVILATLQKEQSLILDSTPSRTQYTIAMGQGCPDTAACDTRYYGFFNQVFGAAWQFKRYANPPGTSNYFNWYAPGRTWNVRWHPNAACGSSPVYIENQATANLYYYTPYQPNAAAIRAYSGLGDGCSSYGNRNFYRFFTDWFGSTQVAGTAAVSFTTLERSAHVTALASDGTIWAYPFSGKGGWGARKQVATNALGIETLLSPGDVDGDGKRDLIGVDDEGKAYLWRGDGNSAYRAPTSMLVDWGGAALITAAGDFSGDGIPDVFTTNEAGALFLWRGTGTGKFRQPVQVGNGWSGMDLLTGGADLSGDGKVDLVARDGAGKLWLYLGNGAGGFAGKLQIGNGWSTMTKILIPGNFAGTSLPDVLAVNATGGLQLFTGSGNGRIRSGGTVGKGWGTFVDVLSNAAPSSVVRTHDGGAGDVSGNGHRDLLALTAGGELRAYHGNGRGGWDGTSSLATGWSANDLIVTLGDFDGNGESDIGRVDENGVFTMIPGTASGRRGSPVQIGSGWDVFAHVVGGVDFDGDDNLDVLAVDDTGNMLLYRGNGEGGWIPGLRDVVGKGWQIADLILAPGDWNGDGKPDLLMRRSADGSFWQYSLSGQGSFVSARQFAARWDGMTVAAPGQFDGVAGPDVLASDPSGNLFLYPGNGAGGWQGVRIQIGVGWSGMASIR